MMSKERDQIQRERRRLKEEYGKLFEEVTALLFRHDPVEINFEFNADEYEPETGSILPKLRLCESADDVRQMVHDVFVQWFDPEIAGSEVKYSQIAAELWELWRNSSLSTQGLNKPNDTSKV